MEYLLGDNLFFDVGSSFFKTGYYSFLDYFRKIATFFLY